MKRHLWAACLGLLAVAPMPAGEPGLRATLDFHRDQVYSVAFNPDGNTLASVGDCEVVELWDVATNRKTATLKAEKFEIVNLVSVLFSPDGKTLATAGYCPGTVKVWDLASRKNTITIEIVTSRTSLAFNPNGKTLVSATDDDGQLEIWDVATGKKVGSFRGQAWYPVAFSPDGKTLASSGGRSTIKFWDAATGKSKTTIDSHLDRVGFLTFSPDSAVLAWSGDYTEPGRQTKFPTESSKKITLWDVAHGVQHCVLQGHTDAVCCVAFSPDGKTLASGSSDNTVKFWNAATGKNTGTLQAHKDDVNTVAFSPDGTTLASGSRDGTIKLWDMTPVNKPAGR